MEKEQKLVDKPCVECGEMMFGVSVRVRKCALCRESGILIAREKYEQKRKEKQEAARAKRLHETAASLNEIVRRADAEGLSYGHYCAKYRI